MTVAAASLMMASCESLGTLNRVNNNQANVASASYPATVVGVVNTTIDTSSTAKNLGTGIGALVGAGAGQLLGGGSGRLVSALGFGAAGALAGMAMLGLLKKDIVSKEEIEAEKAAAKAEKAKKA